MESIQRKETVQEQKLFSEMRWSNKYIYGQELFTTQFNTQMANGNTPSLYYYVHKSLSCHIAKKFLALLPEAKLICP